MEIILETILPHSSLEERYNLISKEQTLNLLNIQVEKIKKFSTTKIISTCVVCKSFYEKPMISITTSKGLTCSPECSTKLKSYKHTIIKANESEETREKRIRATKDFYLNKDKVANKLKKMQQTSLKRYGVLNPIQNSDIKEKARQNLLKTIEKDRESILTKRAKTNLDKHGIENPFKHPEFHQKLKKQNQEKYGVDYLTQLPEFKDNHKKKLLEKYGVENPAQVEEFKQKKKQTCLEKYGFENPRQSSEIQTKIEDTCEKRYGIRNLLSSEEFRKKGSKTLLEKYGVKNPGQIKGHHEKSTQTSIEKYGVDHFKQLPSERNKLSQWCEENPEKLFTSKAEQEIKDWIRTFYPSATKHRQDGHEIDIFIPELKIGIEYNGLFWHSESTKVRTYHLEKTKHFQQLGIRVAHIFEHEWRDKKHQVQSYILSAIGKNSIRLSPRNCNVVWSDSKEEIKRAHQLLDDYHIQGHARSTKYVTNVYYNEELVATATFGKHHRNGEQWVLSRFCTRYGHTVRGLLGKVSKLAYSNLQQPIISWADYRLSQGNGYEKSGWKFEELLPPDYFYFKISTSQIISKQSRQKKKVNTPEEMTEIEHAHLDGLERVWDCGKIRYSYVDI